MIIGGMVLSTRSIMTRTGRRMAILNFEDNTGRIEITLFSKLSDEISDLLSKDKILIIKGHVEEDNYTGGMRKPF